MKLLYVSILHLDAGNTTYLSTGFLLSRARFPSLRFSWAIPDERALRVLKHFSPIVEVSLEGIPSSMSTLSEIPLYLYVCLDSGLMVVAVAGYHHDVIVFV